MVTVAQKAYWAVLYLQEVRDVTPTVSTCHGRGRVSLPFRCGPASGCMSRPGSFMSRKASSWEPDLW